MQETPTPETPDYIFTGAPEVRIYISKAGDWIRLSQLPEDPGDYEQNIVLPIHRLPELVALFLAIHNEWQQQPPQDRHAS
jgi:hypothetical protein